MQGISLSDVFLVVVGSVSTETHVLRAYLSHYGHSLNNLRRPRFPVWYKHFCWKPSALPNLDKLPKHSSFKFIYYNLMLFNISRKPGPCWRCILFSLHFTPYIYYCYKRGSNSDMFLLIYPFCRKPSRNLGTKIQFSIHEVFV